MTKSKWDVDEVCQENFVGNPVKIFGKFQFILQNGRSPRKLRKERRRG